MHSSKSAISLWWMVCAFQLQGSFLIVAVRNSVRPNHLFDHNFDHDYLFELPAQGSGMPNHYAGDLLHTMAMYGLSHVRTELLPLLIVPFLTPHPVQVNRKFPGHRYFSDLSSPA
jgi:hypothetical protein